MSKFNENLLGFVKKQYPEDIMQNYEELYNLYANNQIKFCSGCLPNMGVNDE